MVVFKFRNLKTGQAMPIPAGEFSVGRADDAYVHVDDPSVSRNHARLTNNEEGFFVEDTGSSNGTAFRGAFLTTRTQINFGNVVHIGSVPFRVDPEVEGQIEIHPPPSSRNVSLDSMRRDTERIPIRGEAPWVPEPVTGDKLSAPEISSVDSEAEELNAVTFRDPEPASPPQPQPLTNLAPVANLAPVPPQQASLVSVPTQQRSIAPQQQPRQQAFLEAEERMSSLRESTQPALDDLNQEETVAQRTGSGRIWYLAIFFAGLGLGLLLGLIFAKIFFEMGGKPAGLP